MICIINKYHNAINDDDNFQKNGHKTVQYEVISAVGLLALLVSVLRYLTTTRKEKDGENSVEKEKEKE